VVEGVVVEGGVVVVVVLVVGVVEEEGEGDLGWLEVAFVLFVVVVVAAESAGIIGEEAAEGRRVRLPGRSWRFHLVRGFNWVSGTRS